MRRSTTLWIALVSAGSASAQTPEAPIWISVEPGQTVSDDNLVPNLHSCIRCEADHKWDGRYRGREQDHTRRVSNLVAINNPYQVVIGVTGADGLGEGAYVLQVSLSGR